MSVATTRVEVGVRELKNHLSRYLDDVGNGAEVTVTDRGRPVARLIRVDASTDRLADLIAHHSAGDMVSADAMEETASRSGSSWRLRRHRSKRFV